MAKNNEITELIEELKKEVEQLEKESQLIQQELNNYTELKGWSFEGEYSNKRKYQYNNVVYFRGGAYILRAKTNVGNPIDDRAWQLLSGNDATYHPVKTVNNIGADENGNINLGQITHLEDLKVVEKELMDYIEKEISLIKPSEDCLTEEYLDKELEALKKNMEDRIEEIEKPTEPEIPEEQINKETLKKFIEKAKNTDTTGKTEESIKTLDEAIEHGEFIYNKEDATKEEIRDAIKQLQDAINGLEDIESPELPEPYDFVYGVEIDENNPDPYNAVKYIEDNASYIPLFSGTGNVDYGSWENKFPIAFTRVVLLRNGEVVEELDKNDYTKTIDGRTVDITSGDSGDVMVGIPLTYWKFERVGSKLRIYISNRQVDSDFKAYAHSRNGVVQDDYLYIGAYKGSVQEDELCSLHDVMSTGNETISEFREYATNKGEGYGQMNWATMTLMQIFTVLLTKSLDSQTALGRGNVNSGVYIRNGSTTKKGLFYGEQTGREQMKFLGIEDFYGNRNEYVDGLVRKDDKFWTNINNTKYNDDAVGYTEAGVASNFSSYFKTVIGTTESGFIPAERGGSSSTYYCDYYSYRTGHRVALFGGYMSDFMTAGSFRLYMDDSPDYANPLRTARCLYLRKK